MEEITLADKYLTFSEESKKLLKSGATELLIYTFNKVYPGICDFFNNGEIRNVIFETDSECGSPALITVFNTVTITVTDDDTGKIISEEKRFEIIENNKIKFNPHDKIFQQQPMDIDFITHELVHVAQDYKLESCPQWVCEGLADYGREKFGLNNKKGGWSLPKYKKYQKYTDGYRVTAAFFIWLEENIVANFVKDLNNTIKTGKYTDNYFAEKTGKPVDELWQMYADANKAAQRRK